MEDRSADDALNDGYAQASFGKTPRQLTEMSESELLIWQESHPRGSPQSSMAEREWERRLVVEQIKVVMDSNSLAREANDIARAAGYAATAAASSASNANILAGRSNFIAVVAAVIAAIAVIAALIKS
jgi:hypothetical protein